jgi:hypothetical protein
MRSRFFRVNYGERINRQKRANLKRVKCLTGRDSLFRQGECYRIARLSLGRSLQSIRASEQTAWECATAAGYFIVAYCCRNGNDGL